MAGAPPGEQPPTGGVGRGGLVGAGAEVLAEKVVERRRDGGGGLAEADEQLAVLVRCRTRISGWA